LIETGAGLGIGFDDEHYRNVGATIAANAAEVFTKAEMVVKVKEPQPQECQQLRPGQTLFTYLHLAADAEQAKALMASGCTAIAYETVTDKNGGLPLLSPMSEVAGRMSIQVGARCLEKYQGGSGVLMGGVPGVPPAKVVILGAGKVGTNAARMAMGMEARVTVLDKSIQRLYELDLQFGSKITTLFATMDTVEQAVMNADLVVGAVLVPGAAAPRIVSAELIKKMRPGSVVVDVSIDQGGCFETSRPTSHSNPTYVVDHVVHYCVTNMPGAVARTAAFALNNATLPFVLQLANLGTKAALKADQHLANGLNVDQGKITHAAVAEALGL
jgi:alanine dehydrogenase